MISALAGILAGIAALIAVILARSQLGQLITSNTMLRDANNAAAAASLDLIRPYVFVDLHIVKHEFRDPNVPLTADLRVRVRNGGRTVARNVRLSIDPPFEQSKRPDGVGAQASAVITETLDSMFDGSVTFPALFPDSKFSYLVDNAKEHVEDKSLTRRHVVTVRYRGQDEDLEFTDVYELDVEMLGSAFIDTDGLRRISRDLQALKQSLDKR
jgi:hypothetical protein